MPEHPKYKIESVKNAEIIAGLAAGPLTKIILELIKKLPLIEQVELEMLPDRIEMLNQLQILLIEELATQNSKLAENLLLEFLTKPGISVKFGTYDGISEKGLVLLRAILNTSDFRNFLGLTEEQKAHLDILKKQYIAIRAIIFACITKPESLDHLKIASTIMAVLNKTKG